MVEEAGVQIDIGLLRGFRFACRPDCGLCCYAEPRVEPSDRGRLLQIAPQARFVGRGSNRFIAARPDGGACQFLALNRCSVHSARPHPCREFPVTVHVGRRLQATVVLSCPGVDLTGLATVDSGSGPETSDFETELDSIRRRLGHGAVERLAICARRRRKIERALGTEGRWQDDDEVRAALRGHIPLPGRDEFPVEDPPEASEGMERLPLFFADREAPLAWARGLGGWEVLQLSATGGGGPIAVIPSPDSPPSVDAQGSRLLEGYLRYSLERDAFLAAVHLDALEATDGSVMDWAAQGLRALGAMTLARAIARAKLRGGEERLLTERDVADGIRATDMDWLDRPTWGDRF